MHLELGRDRSKVEKLCLEKIKNNSETKESDQVHIQIKFSNHTTSGVSMSVSACSEGADTCHVNAKYVYFDKTANCECITPFYGNEIRCLKTGKRLILRGKVNGVLNNKAIENVDLLSYVYTTNGRIETHMRSKQNTVKTMMKILQPIGDIIGWMFAVPQGKKAKNGFMMTGGELNRTALIKYQRSESVLITQQLSTISSEFKVQTFIKGTVPDPVDSILFNDFTDQYRRVSRGQEIKELRQDHDELQKGVEALQLNVQSLEVEKLESMRQSFETKMSNLQEKQLLLEIHDRKYNVLVYGMPEKSDENIWAVLDNLMINYLKLDKPKVDSFPLTNAHRIPARQNTGERKRPNPIIIRFMHYADKQFSYRMGQI
ncbi:NID [Mytilus coruscus]|uniref:NID n=1 Tax=Mytilus coruscus TaxID=42192 RepID=A0A6J8CVV1_MYTCO|nr:NID [Mytilus coruscus]